MLVPAWLSAFRDEDLAALVEGWKREGAPFHVLIFLPEKEIARVPAIQAICRQHDVHVAGAVFPQLVAESRCQDQGLLAIKVTDSPAPLLLEGMSNQERVSSACRELAAHVELSLTDDRTTSLFCIFDALVPNVATHLDAWYLALADRVNYFGVNAGSETFAPMPCLFDTKRQIAYGALVQLLPGHPGACLNHDYGVPDVLLTATSAIGNRIVQIDWQPPLEIYRNLMLSCYGVTITQENFYEHAVHFPFGILRADGEVLVRIPVALGDDGSIFCVGEIPPNSVLTLLDARVSNHRAHMQLASDLIAQGTPVADEDLLLFYCAGRRMHMGPMMQDELEKIAKTTRARRVLGALSLGEIGGAHSGGYPLFHNATLVGVPCR